ncbi:MAG: hypothetical protein LBM98_04755 [Oscillospiraceae bacterium]|jgi:hypothetical protein|nr:hypothetical protein [Oscillospiraceae bacterium]
MTNNLKLRERVIIGLVIILFALTAVWYFASPTRYPAIRLAELPPQQPSPAQLENTVPRAEVNAASAKAVVATLARPGSYVMNYNVTIYWDGGEYAQNIELVASSDIIMVNGEEYAKTDDSDAIAGLPTYEDILKPEVIVDEAEYKEAFGSVYLRVRYEGLLYTHEYYISLYSGLLEHARKYDDKGKTVYAMDVAG